MIVIKKKYIYIALLIILITISISKLIDNKKLLMGGIINTACYEVEEIEVDSKDFSLDQERFFRPSKQPILNTRNMNFEYDTNIKPNDIKLPKEFFKTPSDTIINYYSTLREAANPTDNTNIGCGTLGSAKEPYKYAYNYFTNAYKEKNTYKKYLKSFEDIQHINLIKLEEVPTDKEHNDDLKYFVEIETIQGSKSKVGMFAYYYGYIYLSKEDGIYKIDEIDYTGENYLCAPYHGWSYDAELSVDIRYGDWCKLIKEKRPTEQDGFKKKVKFLGTDNNEYMILFYQLTNGVDLEIAQYKMDENGEWVNIYLDTTKCIEQ
ncbi:MAG: hypothetical protein ACRDA3_00845 [Peptostreptococcaceae bacterium]